MILVQFGKNMKESIYQYKTYKSIIASRLMGPGRRGQMTMAAQALGVQPSYISRVLTEELQLTPDHAFKLSLFWRLNSDERDYFRLLVDFERAGDLEYKKFLQQQIEQIRQKKNSVQERADRSNVPSENLQFKYFSSWIWSAIHFLTSIPEYQKIENLAYRLNIRTETLTNYLYELADQDMIENKNGKWAYKSGEFHAKKDSPLVIMHHQNWRTRAIQDAQDYKNQSVHFTAVQAVSKKDYDQIKEMMLQFIENASRLAGPSKPEEGIVITCDCFKI